MQTKKHRLSIQFDQEIKDKVQAFANDTGVSFSAAVNVLMSKSLWEWEILKSQKSAVLGEGAQK